MQRRIERVEGGNPDVDGGYVLTQKEGGMMGVDETADDEVVATAMQQLNEDGFETKGSRSSPYFPGLSMRELPRDGTWERKKGMAHLNFQGDALRGE
jgi:hypothetical protein